jgi:hypothetical protein
MGGEVFCLLWVWDGYVPVAVPPTSKEDDRITRYPLRRALKGLVRVSLIAPPLFLIPRNNQNSMSPSCISALLFFFSSGT